MWTHPFFPENQRIGVGHILGEEEPNGVRIAPPDGRLHVHVSFHWRALGGGGDSAFKSAQEVFACRTISTSTIRASSLLVTSLMKGIRRP